MGRLCTAPLGGRRGLLESELDATLSTAASKQRPNIKTEVTILDQNNAVITDDPANLPVLQNP